MDNHRETTGAKKKQEADISSISEDYTSTESSEYNSSEDSSDDEFMSNRKYKTTLVKSEFLSDDGINQALKIEILILPRVWRDNITAQYTYKGKAIGRVIARFIYRGMITKDFWEEIDKCSQETEKIKFKLYPVHWETGVWRSELDNGPLLLIKEGIGHAMCVNSVKLVDMLPGLIALEFSLVTWFQKLSTVHTLVMPGWLTEDIQSQYIGKLNSLPCFMEPLDDREEKIGMGDYIILYRVEIQLRERTLLCVEYLKKATAKDKINLIIVDRTYKTLLHILARRLKLERNLDILDNFQGYSSTTVDSEDPDLSVPCLKYGCTCGQYIGGFLSPRMKLALLNQAETLYNTLSDSIDNSQNITYNGYINIFSCNILQVVKQRTGDLPGIRAYSTLSVCYNDCEFKFVAWACGLDLELE
ncbi:hypothetical protein BDV23DRAFT_177129 [Aspergillus alliaceus]|uniref:Uncharacterized protein n=1 Tax=Petromyces alliaceus TaxID=209559 RepID=A0A5N7BR94_PETAA|nr:hypothetical protein BDV23DRAFT_177129 [Aspergillus alliaceus]